MKSLYLAAAACLIALAGCASLQPKSFNEKLAVGISTVIAARTTATVLLSARKITADDAQNVQNAADNARAGLELARTIHATLPEQGNARLNAVLVGINGITTYLCSRDKSQPLCVGAP